MCGIIGYVGYKPATPVLLDGLQRLEYRGYDSAGIAVVRPGQPLVIRKAVGKLSALADGVAAAPPEGSLGIGHTRWATHGKPTTENAHPHADCTGQVVVIHNGIIENYVALKRDLLARGHTFASQTDTETLAHLIEDYLQEGQGFEDAFRQGVSKVQGASAIMALWQGAPDRMLAARLGNAGGIVVGYGQGEMYLASDLPALLPYTRDVVFLANREVAAVTARGAHYTDLEGHTLRKSPQTLALDPVAASKGGYKHFMLKEIMEQPEALTNALRGRVEFDPPDIQLEDLALSVRDLRRFQRVVLVGMGTSYHAAMVGHRYFEHLAGLPAEVENASEFRYREPLLDKDTLVVSVAQSGETVDTLAAMEEAARRGACQVTICNTEGSQATRVADATVFIRAGLEVGVASSKTLVASITCLFLLAAYIGKVRGALGPDRLRELVTALARLPNLAGHILERDRELERLATRFHRFNNFLYLGRGISYPVALEGALKLKELSYIHAEGYPAGEMKHGAIALIDENMPVVAIALQDALHDKVLSNISEVKARDGTVIALGTEGDQALAALADYVIPIPPVHPLLSPVLAVLPLQLLAYHIAVRRGCDVDQPRNLAKTVTVE
ncbi:MAG: glutamine--fructose-6-phosphate transaminase (isomerizing) [Chloroflexi bacterium]|nr:glutamine--fructose-6-phosphate transaminase (isomerizing) [Chloroflexota bacterium]